MSGPAFLDLEEVLDDREQLARFGGGAGIRDARATSTPCVPSDSSKKIPALMRVGCLAASR